MPTSTTTTTQAPIEPLDLAKARLSLAKLRDAEKFAYTYWTQVKGGADTLERALIEIERIRKSAIRPR